MHLWYEWCRTFAAPELSCACSMWHAHISTGEGANACIACTLARRPAGLAGLHQVAEVGGGGRLDALCDLVMARLAESGLLLAQDERKVKLHATVLNTR